MYITVDVEGVSKVKNLISIVADMLLDERVPKELRLEYNERIKREVEGQ